MRKICPKCQSPQVDERLAVCPTCKQAYVKEGDLVLYLAPDTVQAIVERMFKSRRFLIAVLLFAAANIALLFSIYKLASAQIKRSIATAQTNMHEQLRSAESDVTNRIAQAFEEPRVKELMAQVASVQSSNIMFKAISPAVQVFTNELNAKMTALEKGVSNFQTKADVAIADLKSAGDISFLLAKSMSFDRGAFERLMNISMGNDLGTNQEYSRLATEALAEMVTRLGITRMNFDMFNTPNPWRDNAKPDTASWDEYVEAYSRTIFPGERMILLRQVMAQERFRVEHRIAYVGQVLEKEQNILVLDEACKVVEPHAKIGKNVAALNEYLEWFRKWKKDHPELQIKR